VTVTTWGGDFWHHKGNTVYSKALILKNIILEIW